MINPSCTSCAPGVCQGCAAGRYLSGGDCKPCTSSCAQGAFLVVGCSAQADIVCQGEYLDRMKNVYGGSFASWRLSDSVCAWTKDWYTLKSHGSSASGPLASRTIAHTRSPLLALTQFYPKPTCAPLRLLTPIRVTYALAQTYPNPPVNRYYCSRSFVCARASRLCLCGCVRACVCMDAARAEGVRALHGQAREESPQGDAPHRCLIRCEEDSVRLCLCLPSPNSNPTRL